MKQRITAWILVCLMVLTALPVAVFAAEDKCPGVNAVHTKNNCTYVEVSKNPGTCGGYSSTNYKCVLCEKTFAADFVKLPDGEHQWKVITPAVPSTVCGVDGVAAVRECEVCEISEKTYLESIGKTLENPKPSHKDHVFEQGTCGQTVKCKYCTYTSNLPGHNWGMNPIVTVEPTSTTDGKAVYTCTACKETIEVKIAKKCPHDQIIVSVVDIAKTENEVSYYKFCEACNKYFNATSGELIEDGVTIDAGKKLFKGHKIVKLEGSDLAPTCTRAGLKFYHCAADCNCNSATLLTFSVDVPALGHTKYDDPASTNKNEGGYTATCLKQGNATWTCGRVNCGVQLSDTTPATGHDVKTVKVDATCYAFGYSFQYCANENCDAPGWTIPTNPDKYVWELEDKNYECDVTVDGKGVHLVGMVANSLVLATGVHNYEIDEDHADAKAATCEEFGYTVKVCTNTGCKASEKTMIEKLGHNYKFDKTVAPTCTDKGHDLYVCENNDSHTEKRNETEKVYTDKFDNLEAAEKVHNLTGVTPTYDIEATCDATKASTYVYKCTTCETNISVTVDNRGEHEPATPVVDQILHCGVQDGIDKGFTCKNCGLKIKDAEKEKAAAHTYVTLEGKAATHTSKGLKTIKYCSTCGFLAIWNDVDNTEKADKLTNKDYYRALNDLPTSEDQEEIAKIAEDDGTPKHDFQPVKTTQKLPNGATYKTDIAVLTATCANPAQKLYKCVYCDEYEIRDYGAAKGHGTTVETKTPATCTTAGEIVYTCADCGEEVKDKTVIPATGHRDLNGIAFNLCDLKKAEDAKACLNCSPSTPIWHNYAATGVSAWNEVTVPASCGVIGYTQKVCPACGEAKVIREDASLAGAHTLSAWTVTKAPTATEDGEQRRDCTKSGCDYYETMAVPMTAIEISMDVQNANGDKLAITESSLIKVVVTLKGANKAVYSVKFDLGYDMMDLEFVEAKFLSDKLTASTYATNVADDLDFGSNLTVVPNTDSKYYTAATAPATITVMAVAPNTAEGQLSDVIITPEGEEVVELYFKVLDKSCEAKKTVSGSKNVYTPAFTLTGANNAKTIELEIDNVEIKNAKGHDGVDVTASLVDNGKVEFTTAKFLDVNGDATVDTGDMKRIASIISGADSLTYSVAGDVDQDGDIDFIDYKMLCDYIGAVLDYEDLVVFTGEVVAE